MKILLVALLVFLINLPFGALRGSERKYSFKWFLYIHLPIPLVVFLRIFCDIGFALYTYPVLIAAFFGGQLLGRKFLPLKARNKKKTKTDCA
ncbi:hypothetical protein [Mangrovibacterium marinum]|uniref:Uncharacterized protein n=1 Tax=Mangrovibacterium marinum TaxID=1639118 RepID=A0A2T5C5R4_9BACT|nr:hypothetical protein [Mangrovibacterium marinum]PTN10246.1 hypothetical protein C8N47_102231 [Mangrovibacterium marinum]